MSSKTLGIVLGILGVLIILAVFLAKPLLNIGSSGFGYLKISGVVVGVIVLLAGAWLAFRRPAA